MADLGPPAQGAAQEFVDQQAGLKLPTRQRTHIARGFDPFKAQVAETPQEAGEIVSQSVQNTAAARKADVNAAYKEARGYPGEIHAAAFRRAWRGRSRAIFLCETSRVIASTAS